MTAVNVGGYATVSADGSFSLDGAVNKAIDALEGGAPDFVKKLEAGAAAGSVAYGSVVASVAEAAAELGVTGEAAAALSAAVPIVGLAVAVIVGLLVADGASAGAGCCGAQPLTLAQATAVLTNPLTGQKPTADAVARLMRFGSCDPSQYAWTGSAGFGAYKAPAQLGELYLSNMIRAAFEKVNDCWHVMPPEAYGQQLALAAAVWNATHLPTSTRVVSRRVNVPTQTTFAGKVQPTTYAAQDNEPISVAMQQSAQHVPHNGVMTLTLHTGPASTSLASVVRPGATQFLGGALLGGIPKLAPIKAAPAAASPINASTARSGASSGSGAAVAMVAGGAALALFMLLRR